MRSIISCQKAVVKSMKIQVKLNPFQSFYFIISFFVLSSCSSIKRNYLGSAEREPISCKIDSSELAILDSNLKHTEIRTDSLIQVLSKKKNRHLTAIENNQLILNFGNHLYYDRTFNSLLQKGNKKKDALTDAQCYYAIRLLQSALYYDRTFQNKRKIRRMLNRGDDGNRIPKNIIQKSRSFLYSPAIRKKLKQSIKSAKTDSLFKLLPSTNFLKYVYYNTYRKNDRFINGCYSFFTFCGTKLLGKSSGHNKASRVKHRKLSAELSSKIQAYDILLTRNSKYITSTIIPGYFGHAAIWLGADELHPKRKKIKSFYRKNKIKHPRVNEKGLIEAVRSGVEVNSLNEFTDGDEYLILRIPSLTEDQKKNIKANAIKHLKKSYDFNFDIESPDMINCTELVYLAYDLVEWKVSPFMGRFTIFPDNLLETAIIDKRFEIVAFMKDGTLTLHPDVSILKSLIK